MNILLEKLPTAVEIDGREYELNTDFRTCLNIILAFEDTELTDYEKRIVMLGLLYKEVPDNIREAIRLGVKFLNCGEEDKQEASNAETKRVFSFNKDAKYIYTAIKQTHDVDLESIEYLHWWKFYYMFLDINEDCFFSRILYYRNQRNHGKLTKEEREYCAKIHDILELPHTETSEEKAAKSDFMRLLGNS